MSGMTYFFLQIFIVAAIGLLFEIVKSKRDEFWSFLLQIAIIALSMLLGSMAVVIK